MRGTLVISTILMILVPMTSIALVQCIPVGTCQCRRFRMQAVNFPSYHFLMTNPDIVNVMASIQCRSRNSGGQSQIAFEVSMAGNISGRTMNNGGSSLTFAVFHPGSTSVPLGNGSNVYTYSGTIGANYAVIPLTFPAEIFTNQNVVEGTYQARYRFWVTHPQNNNVRTRSRNPRFRVSVQRVCDVTATDINLGVYYPTNPGPTTGIGTLTMQCTPHISASIEASIGSGSSTYTNRVLTNGHHVLQYNLYTNAGMSTILGDGSGGSQPIAHMTNGGIQITHYYARIPPKQFDPVGNYASNVVLSLFL